MIKIAILVSIWIIGSIYTHYQMDKVSKKMPEYVQEAYNQNRIRQFVIAGCWPLLFILSLFFNLRGNKP